MEHLFDEPGYKEDLIEDLLDLDTFEIQKYFNIEDMSGTLFNDQMHIDSCSGILSLLLSCTYAIADMSSSLKDHVFYIHKFICNSDQWKFSSITLLVLLS